MEHIIRNVRDIETSDRRALEHVIGKRLAENQQIVINVVNVDLVAPANEQPQDGAASVLPAWCNVYDGLSDEEIERIDRATSRRLDLTRSSE